MGGPINLNAWTGLNALPVNFRPAQVLYVDRDPTVKDWQNQQLLNMWLNTTNENVWLLVQFTKVSQTTENAIWVRISAGGIGNLQSLTGNSGGAVFATGYNINVLGDGTTVDVVGNPATSTLTISAVGTGVVSTLTGNSGGAVSPTAGNINVVGDGTTITIVGNPGTSTLTASVIGGEAANSFPTDSGTATPSGGVLNIKANVSTLSSGSSVEFTGSSNTVLLNVTDSNGNTIIGKNSGKAGITSVNNTILGKGSGAAITSGTGLNVFIGEASAAAITTGSQNIAIGASSGSSWANTESSNITIGNTGTAAETNTIHIGTQGSGAGQQNAAFMAGINGVTNTNPALVTINTSTNQLGVATFGNAVTFTPGLDFGGGTTGITYASQAGIYSRFGNLVFVVISITLSSKGSSSGTCHLTGLPFTVNNTYSPPFFDTYPISIGTGFTFTAGYNYFWANFLGGTTTAQMIQGGSGVTQAAVTDSNFANNASITATGFYYV